MTVIEALLDERKWYQRETKPNRRRTVRKDRHDAKSQMRRGAFDDVRTKGQTKTQGHLSH
jgi:hypothetical protein